MSVASLMLDIYKGLTGLESPPGKSGDHWKPSIVEALNGYNVIYGSDRITENQPDRAMPFIVMEAGQVASAERQYSKIVTLYFDIAIKGKVGETLDEAIRVSNALCSWLRNTRFASSLMIAPDSIEYSIGDRQTQYVNTRFATITARAVVEEKW